MWIHSLNQHQVTKIIYKISPLCDFVKRFGRMLIEYSLFSLCADYRINDDNSCDLLIFVLLHHYYTSVCIIIADTCIFKLLRMSNLTCLQMLEFFLSLVEIWHCCLGVINSIWLVKNWVMRFWFGYLSGARCKWFACGPADATATQSSLASSKSRLV